MSLSLILGGVATGQTTDVLSPTPPGKVVHNFSTMSVYYRGLTMGWSAPPQLKGPSLWPPHYDASFSIMQFLMSYNVKLNNILNLAEVD